MLIIVSILMGILSFKIYGPVFNFETSEINWKCLGFILVTAIIYGVFVGV